MQRNAQYVWVRMFGSKHLSDTATFSFSFIGFITVDVKEWKESVVRNYKDFIETSVVYTLYVNVYS